MLQIFFTLLKQNFDKGPKLFIVLLLILDIWWYSNVRYFFLTIIPYILIIIQCSINNHGNEILYEQKDDIKWKAFPLNRILNLAELSFLTWHAHKSRECIQEMCRMSNHFRSKAIAKTCQTSIENGRPAVVVSMHFYHKTVLSVSQLHIEQQQQQSMLYCNEMYKKMF